MSPFNNHLEVAGFEKILLLKFSICVLFSIGVWVVYTQKARLISISDPKKGLLFLVSFTLLRILPFLIIYVILDFSARSDVRMFYDSALGALKLGFVYRDFETAYSPIFPYLTALPLLIWNSAKAIVLEMVLVEGIILWFTYKYYKNSLGNYYLLLYLMLPAPFVFSILGGQEDIWMWAFVLWTCFILRKNSNWLLAGIIMGLGLLTTKALLVLYLPALFIFAKKPWQFMLGLLIVGIPSLAFMYYHSELLFLSPIQQANDPRTPNIWSVLHPLTNGLVPIGPKILNWVGLITIQALGIFFALKSKKTSKPHYFLVFLFLIISAWLMIIQQSSLSNYAYVFLMPMVFFFGEQTNKKWLVSLLLLNLLVVIQPPIWWGIGMPIFHSLSDLNSGYKVLEYITEIGIVVLLFTFLRIIIKNFKTTNNSNE